MESVDTANGVREDGSSVVGRWSSVVGHRFSVVGFLLLVFIFRASFQDARPFFCVPGVEMPGYCRASPRDFSSAQLLQGVCVLASFLSSSACALSGTIALLRSCDVVAVRFY